MNRSGGTVLSSRSANSVRVEELPFRFVPQFLVAPSFTPMCSNLGQRVALLFVVSAPDKAETLSSTFETVVPFCHGSNCCGDAHPSLRLIKTLFFSAVAVIIRKLLPARQGSRSDGLETTSATLTQPPRWAARRTKAIRCAV